jgi:hypothetical protein
LEPWKLGYIEPVAGLFHLQMNVLTMIFRSHWGRVEDVTSLARWHKFLNRSSNIYDSKKHKKGRVKDFRACSQLFSAVLEAHILAVVGTQLRVSSVHALCKALEEKNWHNTIRKLKKKYSDLTMVGQGRQEGAERDVVHENAVLFLQHGLMYRDFCIAIRRGDSGRVRHCLQFFTTWFQATTLYNYANETIHMLACFAKAWKEDVTMFWEDHCLVNPSGSPTGWMPDDEFGEQMVKAVKEMVVYNNTPATDRYLREVHSRQTMVTRAARKHLAEETGATDYYQHSSNVDTWFEVMNVANILLHEQVFVKKAGRGFAAEDDEKIPESVATDLQTVGTRKIWEGTAIERYWKYITHAYAYYSGKIHRGEDDGEEEEEEEVGSEEDKSDEDEGAEELEERVLDI